MNLLAKLAATSMVLMVPCVLFAQPVTHETRMEILHGKPYVMVTVNGMGPFRFLVDTGTSGDAVVTPELAAQLKLPEVGQVHLNDAGGSGGEQLSVRLIDKLSIAGVEFYAIKAMEHSLLDGDGPCMGILGFRLFQGFLFTLDFPNRRVVIADGELEADGERLIHPFRIEDGMPLMNLAFGDLQVEAVIDSAGAGLGIPEQLAGRLRFATEPEIDGKQQSLSGSFLVKTRKLATDVRLGDIILDQPWVEINSIFPTANFGAGPMQHFAVTFDQDNLLLRVDGPHKHVALDVTPVPMQVAREAAGKTAIATHGPVQ